MNESRLNDFRALTCPVLSPRVKNRLRGSGIERLPLVVCDFLGWIVRHIDSFHLKAQVVWRVAEGVEVDRIGEFLPIVFHQLFMRH
jgi:hypothetical protein